MRRTGFFLAVALALALAACRQANPTATIPTDASPAGYPGPGDVATPRQNEITVVPTPSSADLATVTGYLMVEPADPQPVDQVILYLAEIIPEAAGTPFLAGFERTTSPRTLTDANGRFVFVDVEPGTYTLILDRISESFMLGSPDQPGADYLFEVQPGQILDLGELVYLRMP